MCRSRGPADIKTMLRPTFTSTAAFRPTSTREVPCRWRSAATDSLWRSIEGGDVFGLIELHIEEQERLVHELEVELEDWSRHPSNSTWSKPHRDSD